MTFRGSVFLIKVGTLRPFFRVLTSKLIMPWKKGNRLQLVRPDEASGRTAEIFDEVKTGLGIPYVPLCFQAFATYPKFLDVHWRAVKPLLATREFFELSARLRAEAYTYVHNYFKVPALGEGLLPSQVAPVVDLLSYVDLAALLLLTVQLQAFDGTIGKAGQPHTGKREAFKTTPEFLDAETATAPVRRVLEEMRHALELPYSTDEQRALAQWPELLFAYWQSLKPVMQSVFHEQALYSLRESAWSCAQEIPIVIDMDYSRLLESGVTADDVATVTRLTELLARGSAASLLNETFAKIGLEGGNVSRTASTHVNEREVA